MTHILLDGLRAVASTAIVALLLAALPQTTLAENSKPVAKVNGVEITERDVALAQEEIGDQLSQFPEHARRRVLVEFLIENQLIAEVSKTKGVAESNDYADRMTYWTRRSLRETYFEKLQGDISEDDLMAFYDQNVKSSHSGEEIRASHILVKSEEEAAAIYEQVMHDGDFAKLAEANSIDPGSRGQGGDLGYFGRNMMVPVFEKTAFALKVNEVSEPVKSQFGWHIIKLVDRRQKAPPSFESIKDQIRAALLRPRLKELLDGLRSSATLEYIDPQIKSQVEAEKSRPQQ